MKCLTVTNSLVYYTVVLIVAAKVSYYNQKDVNFIHVTDTFDRMEIFSPEMFQNSLIVLSVTNNNEL
jgi:hypothetical protein